MPDHTAVRSGAYVDSVSLMQVSAQVRTTPGVTDCLIGMGTPLNVELIGSLGFALAGDHGPNDLVVALRADSDEALGAGLAAVQGAFDDLARRGAAAGDLTGAQPPHTVGAAAHTVGAAAPGANLALISVPGTYAYVDAMDAVLSDLSVMLFSDNVPVEQEISLKRAALERDVLVMGPDCGTAVVNGVALGFANVVRPGRVGIVAASGTGAQQVMTLLDAAGVGVSHCLGVGGRDLSKAVGGLATVQALDALSLDPGTDSVVVVSKPPAPEVLTRMQEHAAGLDVPVHWATLGAGGPDLTASAEAVLAALGHPVPIWPSRVQDVPVASVPGALRGLFCGGTLADEAMLIATEARGPIRSNIPLEHHLALDPSLTAEGDVVIDFGDDRLTQGRPHPMIDPSLRLERIAQEGEDPTCGVLLLDLVLGHGAHRDPAEPLAQAVADAIATAAAGGRVLAVVVTVIGTEQDPQGLQRCTDALTAAGASVFLSNAQATRYALALLSPDRKDR